MVVGISNLVKKSHIDIIQKIVNVPKERLVPRPHHPHQLQRRHEGKTQGYIMQNTKMRGGVNSWLENKTKKVR